MYWLLSHWRTQTFIFVCMILQREPKSKHHLFLVKTLNVQEELKQWFYCCFDILVKTYCLPHLLYGCDIWPKETTDMYSGIMVSYLLTVVGVIAWNQFSFSVSLFLVDERHYWRTFFSKLQHNDNCVCVLWHICPPHPPFIWSLGTSKQIWSKWCLSCSVYNQTASMVEFCTETSPLSDYPCVFYCVIVQSYCSLWPPYVIGGPLYFCPVVSFYLSSIFFLSFFVPRLISAAADWMSTILPHMVWP